MGRTMASAHFSLSLQQICQSCSETSLISPACSAWHSNPTYRGHAGASDGRSSAAQPTQARTRHRPQPFQLFQQPRDTRKQERSSLKTLSKNKKETCGRSQREANDHSKEATEVASSEQSKEQNWWFSRTLVWNLDKTRLISKYSDPEFKTPLKQDWRFSSTRIGMLRSTRKDSQTRPSPGFLSSVLVAMILVFPRLGIKRTVPDGASPTSLDGHIVDNYRHTLGI
ncbi:uncharacterized [Tachysurus ichikawai]